MYDRAPPRPARDSATSAGEYRSVARLDPTDVERPVDGHAGKLASSSASHLIGLDPHPSSCAHEGDAVVDRMSGQDHAKAFAERFEVVIGKLVARPCERARAVSGDEGVVERKVATLGQVRVRTAGGRLCGKASVAFAYECARSDLHPRTGRTAVSRDSSEDRKPRPTGESAAARCPPTRCEKHRCITVDDLDAACSSRWWWKRPADPKHADLRTRTLGIDVHRRGQEQQAQHENAHEAQV